MTRPREGAREAAVDRVYRGWEVVKHRWTGCFAGSRTRAARHGAGRRAFSAPRAGAMQDYGYGLPRIPLPRTPVHKSISSKEPAENAAGSSGPLHGLPFYPRLLYPRPNRSRTTMADPHHLDGRRRRTD
jgi:hypothetical protein